MIDLQFVSTKDLLTEASGRFDCFVCAGEVERTEDDCSAIRLITGDMIKCAGLASDLGRRSLVEYDKKKFDEH